MYTYIIYLHFKNCFLKTREDCRETVYNRRTLRREVARCRDQTVINYDRSCPLYKPHGSPTCTYHADVI
jgi:hypothetical protein